MNQEIIIQFLAGKLNPEEVALLLSWVESSDANKNEFASIKNAWVLAGMSGIENGDKDEKFACLSEKIFFPKKSATIVSFPGKTVKKYWLIAATVFLTAGISSLLGYYVANKSEHKVSQLSVSNGKQICLALSDGTKIWLNSGSALQYPSEFIGKTREVTLQGEAYFEVAHDQRKPFIVHATDINVKVLGTSFNLSSYADDDVTRLTLEKGSVSILQAATGDELGRVVPGQMAIYSRSAQALRLEKVDTKFFSSWKNGQFKFKKMSFEEISKKLGRQYNVQFVFENKKLKSTTYNGSFYNYEPFESVLKLMQTNSPFRYEIRRDTIYIK